VYLVTGGAGFIGSNITEFLVRQGQKVRILDNFSTGSRSNIAQFVQSVEVIEGDLRDLDTVKRAVKGVEFVLHQGAMPSVPVSVKDPLLTNECNVTGTLNLLVAARDSDVSRLVFAGSCAVYGDDPRLPKLENMTPQPTTPYALQKLTGEYYCRQFYKLYGFETISLRYFNVFGMAQDPQSLYSAVIPKFLDKICHDKNPTIYGDGNQTRDFIFIKDVITANLAACHSPKGAGKVFNIASGQRLSINEIVSHMSEILGKKIIPDFEEKREGDINHSVADITKAKDILNFKSKYSFSEGLKKYIAWFLETGGLDRQD